MWETGGEHGTPKEKRFGLNSERFRLALDLFQIPIRDNDPPSKMVGFENALEAHEWVTMVATAATNAPMAPILEAREEMIRRNREG